jgi:hypothetical protein
MDEVWGRLGLVAGALLLAGVTTMILRRGKTGSTRQVPATGLAAGTYLFSSTACPTCRSARDKLVDRVGEAGFEEFVWEQDPGLFSDLGVEAVPAVLVVGDHGSGMLYPGQPDRALRGL